jgi:hypothetical protein
MQGSTANQPSTGPIEMHLLDSEDAAITAAMRAVLSSSKGARPGVGARGQFDALMAPESRSFQATPVGFTCLQRS